MEEILASIRQIISEDGGSSAPKIDGVVTESTIAPRQGPVHAEPVDEEMVSYDTAAEHHAPEESAASSEAEEPGEPEHEQQEQHHGAFMRPGSFERTADDRDHDLDRLAAAAAALHAPPPVDDDEPLLSPESGDAISGAFGALAHSLLGRGGSRSLEDVVIEMLQPMLKQWLDDNLPSIVERKVQEEIERVSRGRR